MTTQDGEAPTIMGLIAEKARLTEGQLYTVTIALLVVLLLTLTGLPGARTLEEPTPGGVPSLESGGQP